MCKIHMNIAENIMDEAEKRRGRVPVHKANVSDTFASQVSIVKGVPMLFMHSE